MKRIVPGKAYTAPLASPHLLEYSWEDVEKDHSLNPLSESDAFLEEPSAVIIQLSKASDRGPSWEAVALPRNPELRLCCNGS